jgi:aspartate/methionine/tyrosine aminotransferase
VVLPLWLKKLLIRTRVARLLPIAHRLTDGGAAFLRYYSDRVLAAPVEELLDPAFFPGPAGPDVIDLNQPAPRFDPPLGPARLAADRHHPPATGLPALRNAIADLYVRRDGRAIDPDREVFVTHGASAAFAAALDAFVNPGERVALFDPCSPLFHLGARSRRARVRWVPTWTEDGRLRFPVKAFEQAVRGAKLLVLCDPANPTGACLAPEDLEYVAWFAAGYNVLIYSDESFARFRYDGRGRSVAVVSGAEKRTITAGSVAQGWGLGSARVGWLAGHRHLVQACGLAANLSAPFVPPICQQLAARAVGEPDDDFTPVLDQFRGRRQYTVDRLRAMGLEPEWPGGGYFIWVSVATTGMDGQTFAERLLKEQRVLVGPGCAFGPGGGGHVRVSFAADDGRLREGLSRLGAFLNGSKNPVPVEEPPGEEPQPEAAPADGDSKPVFSRA